MKIQHSPSLSSVCSGRLYRNTSHVAPPGGSEWAGGEEGTVPELNRQAQQGEERPGGSEQIVESN